MILVIIFFVLFNKMYVSEDFVIEMFSNYYCVVEYFLREFNINVELQFMYKCKMVKCFSKLCKENMYVVSWFIGLMEYIVFCCGKFEFVVIINWFVYDVIFNELNVCCLEEQFDLDICIFYIDYKIKLMKVMVFINNKNKLENILIIYDVVVECIY